MSPQSSPTCSVCLGGSAVQYPVVDLHLDFSNGLTDALVHCPSCGAAYSLEMLDWGGPNFAWRVFRVGSLRPEDVALFMRDATKGYCDLSRVTRERHALLSAAELLPMVVALDVQSECVLASVAVSSTQTLPLTHWREGLPAAADTRWFDALGIAKYPSENSR